MRIAVLAHSFPRFPGDTHGPFVKRLAEALAARGHQVFALVPFDPELRPDPATPLRVSSFRYVRPDRWHRLGYSRTLRRDLGMKLVAYLQSPAYFHFAERALRRLVRREGIDLVHAHWILPNGFVASRVGRSTGVPYAVTLHGSDVFMAERNPLFAALARRALAGAAHVTSCSAELRDRLLALGGAEHAAKVLLVPNGTDLVPAAGEDGGAARALLDRLGLPGGRGDGGGDDGGGPLVAAVGRLVDKKGFDVLLDAAPAILARFPGARIVLGGGGDLRGALEAQARRLGIAGAVTFTGALAHGDVLALVAAADLFVMPSVRDPRGNVDGLPIVVLEAMAAGKPVVATAVSGLPLAVTAGETGLLVPERDPAALAAAVVDLLGDRGRARRFGEAGRRRVRDELNWDAVAAVHDRLCRRAVGGDG
jgi:glycosyltransferase involved in cell wall biosynthesis